MDAAERNAVAAESARAARGRGREGAGWPPPCSGAKGRSDGSLVRAVVEFDTDKVEVSQYTTNIL